MIDPNVRRHTGAYGRDITAYQDALNEVNTFTSMVYMQVTLVYVELDLKNVGLQDILRHGTDFNYLAKRSDAPNP